MSQLRTLIDAAHLAVRRGELAEAERLVDEIRSAADPENYSSTTMDLMVVQGSLFAYRGEWDKARDRLERACVLAARTQDARLELLATSWLSYVAFLEGKLDLCADLSCSVIERRRLADPYALFRASAMLALLLYYIGRVRDGSDWFKFSRRRAEELNDTSVTSALIFDIAAMRASCRRLYELLGKSDDSDLRLDLLFAKSSKNFDRLGAIHVMPPLHLLLEGQVSNLLGAHKDAHVLLEKALAPENHLPPVAGAQARLEVFWAKAKIDSVNIGRDDILAAKHDIALLIDDDDVAVYSRRVADVCDALGLADEKSEFELLSSDALTRYQEISRVLDQKLNPIIEKLLPVVSE